MRVLREYRLVSLSLLVVGVMTVFLAFFFVFVLAPILVILAFYPIHMLIQSRRELPGSRGERGRLRRERLAVEAKARRESIERGG
jgi:hypothetical protein